MSWLMDGLPISERPEGDRTERSERGNASMEGLHYHARGEGIAAPNTFGSSATMWLCTFALVRTRLSSRLCSEPGCAEVGVDVPGGWRCEQHRRSPWDRSRAEHPERTAYGSRWPE